MKDLPACWAVDLLQKIAIDGTACMPGAFITKKDFLPVSKCSFGMRVQTRVCAKHEAEQDERNRPEGAEIREWNTGPMCKICNNDTA